MTEQPEKLPLRPKKPVDKKHLNELLDEALDDTFPASDPPAMLEPATNSSQTSEDKKQ